MFRRNSVTNKHATSETFVLAYRLWYDRGFRPDYKAKSYFPTSFVARRKLESSWRLRCREAAEQYQSAVAEYNKLVEEFERAETIDSTRLELARRAEAMAKERFAHTLNTFADLILRGVTPGEHIIGLKATASCQERSAF